MSRRVPAVALAVLALLAGCSGSSGGASTASTMPVGDWTEGPLREDGDAVSSAISAASDGFLQGDSFAAGDCQKIADVASRAEQAPKPNDQILAAAWASALDHASDAARTCTENNGEGFLAAINGFSSDLGEARERIAAL